MTEKIRLPHLPFLPFARRVAGDQPLWWDLPEASRKAEWSASRFTHTCGGVMTAVDLGEILGVSRKTITRYVRDGIPWVSAEDLCDQIGVHPKEVWNDYYFILYDYELMFEVESKIDDLVDDKIMDKIGGQ